MKTTTYFLACLLLFACNLTQAQEDKKYKVNVLGYGGIGYGIVSNDNQPNYNLNSNHGELLLNYSLGKNFGIATGIGVNELTGNGFNTAGDFYHERTLLKVPLLFTLNSDVTENLGIFGSVGFYGQNIIKDEYTFLSETQNDVFEGWNFGAQFGLGFLFEVMEHLSAGIYYHGQADLSKFESNANGPINDQQKLESLNTVGLMVMFGF